MIERYLSIIEVSQKQAYIFGSNRLLENTRRSAEIWWLTMPEKIQELLWEMFKEEELFDASANTVYAGGGHTVLSFKTYEQAYRFNRRYSFLVHAMNPDIEVFLFILPYCSKIDPESMLDHVCSEKKRSQEIDEKFAESELRERGTDAALIQYTPGQYLSTLVKGLEIKKSLRLASFRQGSFGVEIIDSNTRGIRRILESYPQKTGAKEGKSIPKMFLNRTNDDGTVCPEEQQAEQARIYFKEKAANKAVGIDKRDQDNNADLNTDEEEGSNPVPHDFLKAYQFEDLGGTKGDVNFLAVVHIDGNGMGARCNQYYESLDKYYLDWVSREKADGRKYEWEEFKRDIYAFSKGIDTDYKDALSATFMRIAQSISDGKLQELSLKTDKKTGKKYFPIRGLIASGDDICFVTDGRIGIECAAIFLEELSKKTNKKDGKPYCASAGVAIVHQKYPFFRAYELAEKLCDNAKKFTADLRKKQLADFIGDGVLEDTAEDAAGGGILKQIEDIISERTKGVVFPEVLKDNGAGICAIDWHLEMGEIGMSVDEIRRNYQVTEPWTGKERQLEMRPYIVTAPCDVNPSAKCALKTIEPHRQYEIFRKQMQKYLDVSNDKEHDVHAVLKEMRGILKQGQAEAEHFIRFHKLKGLIVDNYHGVFKDVEFREDTEKLHLFVTTSDGKERSVIFDAAEALEIFALI